MAEDAQETGRGWGWAFIDLAALGRNTPRSYAITLLWVIVLPIAFLALSFVAIFFAGWRHLVPQSTLEPAALVAAFASVIVAGLCLAWRVERSHRRPWMSLISADLTLDWRRLAIGAGVEGVLMLGVLAVTRPLTQKAPQSLPITLPAVLLAILLTPFQAAAEEMLFRGYLTQALGRLIRSRTVIVIAVGIVFGALHFGAYGALTIPYLFILSAIFSLATLRDGRLELSIGAHAANNWLALSAAYVLGTGPTSAKITLAALGVLVVNGVLFYALAGVLVRVFCGSGAAR